jgi:uncharacterized protein (DUF58 family)
MPSPDRTLTQVILVPASLAMAFEGLAWLTGTVWLHVLAAVSGAVVVAALLQSPRITGLVITVEHPTAVTVGQASTHRFTVTNTGSRTTSTAHLRDHTHGMADVVVLVPALAPRESASIDVVRTATDRGVTPGHALTVSSSAPYGVVLATSKSAVAVPLVVRPALVPVPVVNLREPDDERASRASVRRDGPTVRGLREWRSGDDARQVHWRASARRGQLVVLEHEAPRRPTLNLLAITASDRPIWEHSVRVLASLAVQGVRAGHDVNLFADQPVFDTLLSATVESALDGCATIEPAGWPKPDLVERAAQVAGAGGQVHVVAHGMRAEAWPRLVAAFARYGVDLVDVTSLPAPR